MDWIRSLTGSSVQNSTFGLKASEQADDKALLEAAIRVVDKPEEARLIYLKLADKGNAEAQYLLGSMDMMDTKKDQEQAVTNIIKAAEQGHFLAINELGRMYETGHGVEQNYEKAFECFEKVADQIPAAKASPGIFYYNGWYVQQNDAMAFHYFSEVQDSDSIAANLLGTMYNKAVKDLVTYEDHSYGDCNQTEELRDVDKPTFVVF